MDNLGVIPARLASTRLANKILRLICGKPMVQIVWENAKKAKLLDDVIIACDDEQVKKVCMEFGAKVQFTAKEHASGTDRLSEVVNPLDIKNVINIQADEPLIKPQMIDSLINTLIHDKEIQMATLAKRITNLEDLSNPNVVKVVKDKSGWALYFSRSPIPYQRNKDADTQGIFFKHIGLYAYTKDFLFTFRNLAKSSLENIEQLEQLRVLENGYKIKIIETDIETIGVDTPEDLLRVEELLKNS